LEGNWKRYSGLDGGKIFEDEKISVGRMASALHIGVGERGHKARALKRQ